MNATDEEVSTYRAAPDEPTAQEVLDKIINTRIGRERRRHRKELDPLRLQAVKFSAENRMLRDKLADAELSLAVAERKRREAENTVRRRDQLIDGLRTYVGSGDSHE